MTRYEGMRRCLETGDPDSALVFWRSKQWADEDRARMVRLLGAALVVAREVLP